MEHVRLGRSGLQVSRLCLGTMTFGLQSDEATGVAIMDRAAEAGVLLVEDLDMLAHVLFGAVAAGVLAMTRSEEPERERDRFRSVMLEVIHGLVSTGDPPGGAASSSSVHIPDTTA